MYLILCLYYTVILNKTAIHHGIESFCSQIASFLHEPEMKGTHSPIKTIVANKGV